MALTWVLKGWLVNGINLGTQRSPLKPNKRGITSFVFHGKKERAPLLCCIFAHPRSGDLSARTSPEEQASEAAPSPRLCTRGVEERSSFWGTHLRDCSLRTTTSSTSRSRLCTANTCTASSLIGYIEQARLAMSGNGASGSFGTGPASGWELAAVLRDTKERFDSAGVKLIAVGVGTSAKARILADRVCIGLVW